MELEIITNGAVLKRPPLLSDEDRKKVRALAVAAGIIRKRDEGFAKTLVRGQTLDILRLSLHNEFPGRFRYTTLTQDEWDAVRAYYPDKYVIEYFTGRAYGPEIRQFVKAADRTFQNVTILGTGGDRDFMILGYVPGDRIPTLLARVHPDKSRVPTISDIREITRVQASEWNPTLPSVVGAIAVGCIGIWLRKYLPLPLIGNDAFLLVAVTAVVGYVLGGLSSFGVNRFRWWLLGRRIPHLKQFI